VRPRGPLWPRIRTTRYRLYRLSPWRGLGWINCGVLLRSVIHPTGWVLSLCGGVQAGREGRFKGVNSPCIRACSTHSNH